MTKTPTKLSFLRLAVLAAFAVIVSGSLNEASAQRDPFEKPAWARTREARTGGAGAAGVKGTGEKPVYGVPAIDQRIEYYKRLREDAVANGTTMPKVTSVLTVDEIAVTGIFKTPRGYAAMVEATPIKLSYTIYPGDRFFDGQLVAVEENRLVFRKVSKVGKDKFVSSVENKSLRKYTDRDIVQGTAPAGAGNNEARNSDAPVNAEPLVPGGKVTTAQVVSPLTEMESMKPVADEKKDKAAKPKSKKPARAAARKN